MAPARSYAMTRMRVFPLLAAALVAIFIISAALSVRGKSSSWDEPFHLTAGIAQLQTASPRLNADHPPLARVYAALPSLFIDTPSVATTAPVAWNSADVFRAPIGIFGTIEDHLLWPSRLLMLTQAVLLGWLLYAWGSRLYGVERSWLPLALFAFCPVMLAIAPLITTDMAATTLLFAAFYTWWRYLQAPAPLRLFWVCVAVAAAFAAKHTALLLVPAFVMLGAVAVIAPNLLPCPLWQRARMVAVALLSIGLATVVGIDLAYFFDGVGLLPAEYVVRAQGLAPNLQANAELVAQFWPARLPLPLPFTYVVGVLDVIGNVGRQGHWTYFIGEAGYGGWPNYFLMLLLVKLSIPSLILIAWGLSRALSRLPRDWWNILFLALPPLLIISVASAGKMQIGIRHILPALPFLFLLAGYAIADSVRTRARIFIGTLLILNAGGCLAMHPDYLMYFNFLGGGPDRGWRISVTGDDWGQGDADLRRWLQAHEYPSLAYLPDGWGGMVLSRANIGFKPPPCEDTGELVAVHVERLMTPMSLEDARCYTWMRLKEPDEKIGYSIFLYNSKNLRPARPTDLTLFAQALKLQLTDKNPTAAIAVYLDHLKREPHDYQAHFNLGIALMETDQCPLAIPEFERTLTLWPGYKEAHLYLAHCYAAAGNADKASWHRQQSP
jgi:4-amino-4-deoxy-L-arabinose transferase-like glycosyltransferase